MRGFFSNHILILVTLLCFRAEGSGQGLFPVKINKMWGLINSDGRLVTEPLYQAIGEFKAPGYAVMQRDGKVGLLDQSAREVIKPVYEDVKVLAEELVAVLKDGNWEVIDFNGKVILPAGYQLCEVWHSHVLGFQLGDKWGMVNFQGKILANPIYDRIKTEKKLFFQTQINNELGLLRADGFEVLAPGVEELEIFNEKLIFYKRYKKWGAVNHMGIEVIPCKFDAFKSIDDNFIKLFDGKNIFLYALSSEQLLSPEITFDNFYPFSDELVIVKQKRHLGLLDACGDWVLTPRYNEIQRYGHDYFRANLAGKWGIVDDLDQEIIPFDFDYIAPLKGKFCIVKKDRKFGVCNFKGKLVVSPDYSKVEFLDKQIKAYEGEALSIFDFNSEGEVLDENSFAEHFTITIGKPEPEKNFQIPAWQESQFVLDDFEWFYAPANDKWGLRRIEDGTIQLDPVFDNVQVEKDLRLSVVGIDRQSKYTFDKTNYRFDMVFGLVNNITGELLTEVNFWSINLEDFRNGNPCSRVMFEQGKFGLIFKSGSILIKDCTYIGDFSEGLARISTKGKLSGNAAPGPFGLGSLDDFLSSLLTPNRMVDFTNFDQKFNREAQLTCEGCEWGYIDTLGNIKVTPQYNFAIDFTNEVGIVHLNKKWGAVNREGKNLIPFEFDEIHFLENTGNKVIRVYKKEEKYGVIDTTGQIKVSAVFDEIGSFSEGKLAVKRNNYWGFVNRNGQELVQCRFQKVENFSEGLAAVKMGNNWGFVDPYGDLIVKPLYKRVGNFSEGLAWVSIQSGYGYLDDKGVLVIPESFQKAFDFKFGVARVVQEGKYGLIDKNGNFILRPKYSDISDFDDFGLAIVRYGSDNVRYGVINLKGEMITRQDFREIRPFKEGMAAVKYKDGYGFINQLGNLVIEDKYSKVSDFSEGFVAVQINGNCGYLDKSGKWLIEPQFSKCLDFKDGKAVVYRGLKNAGLIDKKGNQLIQPQINRLLDFSEGRGLVRDSSYRFYYITEQAKQYEGSYYQRAGGFQHGVAVVQMENKWGIINQMGVEIIPPKYDRISQFENGYAKVRIKGFNGLTNTQGEAIVQPDYEYISYAGEGLFRVEQGDKIGYFDSEGNWIWNLSE